LESLLSNYELELRVINEDKILKKLDNIEISQLQGLDTHISAKTLIKNIETLQDSKSYKIHAKSVLKMTDSHLQLSQIQGLQVRIIPKEDNNIW
jgi:hypothetical protein